MWSSRELCDFKENRKTRGWGHVPRSRECGVTFLFLCLVKANCEIPPWPRLVFSGSVAQGHLKDARLFRMHCGKTPFLGRYSLIIKMVSKTPSKSPREKQRDPTVKPCTVSSLSPTCNCRVRLTSNYLLALSLALVNQSSCSSFLWAMSLRHLHLA